jgi:rhamnosyl/mannosyltransferase
MEAIIDGLKDRAEFWVLVSLLKGYGEQTYVRGVSVRRAASLGQVLAMPIAPSLPFWLWYYAPRVDIVNHHYPFPLVDLAMSLWFPRCTALVVHWHSEIVEQKRTASLLSPLIRRTLDRADCIVVSNPAHIDQSTYLRKARDKCVVIPYGIDSERWRSLKHGEERQVEQLKADYPNLVLAVGRLVAYKGFDYLIRAMVRVSGVLMIVGTGPLERALKDLIAELRLEHRVLMKGEIGERELKVLLHACRLVAVPSVGNNETFGIVQLEAMAVGKPLVNTRLGTAVPWVARHGKEALTVAPADADALAEAIQCLLDRPAQARRLGEAGQKRALALFDKRAFCDSTLDVYTRALRARDARCAERSSRARPAR